MDYMAVSKLGIGVGLIGIIMAVAVVVLLDLWFGGGLGKVRWEIGWEECFIEKTCAGVYFNESDGKAEISGMAKQRSPWVDVALFEYMERNLKANQIVCADDGWAYDSRYGKESSYDCNYDNVWSCVSCNNDKDDDKSDNSDGEEDHNDIADENIDYMLSKGIGSLKVHMFIENERKDTRTAI